MSEIFCLKNFRRPIAPALREIVVQSGTTQDRQQGKMDYADTEPVRDFARRRGISPGRVYQWIDKGELESFLIGHRRHIVVASYDRLVRRLLEQGLVKLPSSNPRAKCRRKETPSATTLE
jgi:hypothetical protein